VLPACSKLMVYVPKPSDTAQLCLAQWLLTPAPALLSLLLLPLLLPPPPLPPLPATAALLLLLLLPPCCRLAAAAAAAAAVTQTLPHIPTGVGVTCWVCL
jgi:hypothetical protein